MSSLREQSIRLPDGRVLSYAECGDVDGEPVLVFHGVPGSRRIVHYISQMLPHTSYRFIAPDRPGYGGSDFQEGRTLLDWADDVDHLLKTLQLSRVSLMGISGGGPYALACAYKIPERIQSVAIVSGLGPLEDKAALAHMNRLNRSLFWMAQHARRSLFLIGLIFRALVLHWPQAMLWGMHYKMGACDRPIFADPSVKEFFRDDFAEAVTQGVQGIAHDLYLLTKPWGFPLESIQIPIHLWHGESDRAVPPAMAKMLEDRLPQSKANYIPEAGHLWIFKNLEEVFPSFRA